MSNLPDVHSAEAIPDTARAELERLLQSGDLFRYTSPETSPVVRLEQEFADMLGVKYALAVASCSAALFLALKALDLPRGARVVIPAFTFAAVPSAVVHADCTPVLVEVDDSLRIDLADFESKLDGADAVLISHMRGHTSDMDVIESLCGERGLPLIEDAAHSLGTTWNGRNIGTIGLIGCFSFQSYKMLNGGEGGILATNDEDLIARAVIMSGAYEHNWSSHTGLTNAFEAWQNKLPLYNTRMSNLSAAVVAPQIAELSRRVQNGRRNHDHLALRLNAHPLISVPAALDAEERAPDSIQFLLDEMDLEDRQFFAQSAKQLGVAVQIFGLSQDNARAYWNWQFLQNIPELPKTRAMLERACDVRLPARLSLKEVDAIGDVLIAAADAIVDQRHARKSA